MLVFPFVSNSVFYMEAITANFSICLVFWVCSTNSVADICQKSKYSRTISNSSGKSVSWLLFLWRPLWKACLSISIWVHYRLAYCTCQAGNCTKASSLRIMVLYYLYLMTSVTDWIAFPQNPYPEFLTSSTSECVTVFRENIFKVIKLK